MDREIPAHLTDMQIIALDYLSMDYGLTNRELTQLMDKKEREEGNIRRKIIEPLLKSGMVYQVKGRYPSKLLFINKSYENISLIKNVLADPIYGKIPYYKKAHHAEQKKYEKRKWTHLRNNDELPEISDTHREIRKILKHCVHLFKWCDVISNELQKQMGNENTRPHFSLLSLRPRCELCKTIFKHTKIHEHFKQHQKIIFEEGVYDLRECQFAPL